jgi:hypothetical protein
MDKKLYKIAIEFLKKSYTNHIKSNNTTQWSSYTTYYNKQKLQVLAIPGTNEALDWFWNCLLLQKDSVKLGSYISAKRILSGFIRTPDTPLLISCHSKSGPTGIYLQELLNAEYCIAFCPARGFKDEKENLNTVMFIDKDDVVPKIGWSIFKHRKCKTIYLPDDKEVLDIKGIVNDHLLDHMEEFIEKI